MNGSFFDNPTFPGNKNNYTVVDEALPNEQSYIENILRLNKGKLATVYVSFPDATEWKNKVFKGRIEAAGRDHLILSNPENGEWYLILMIYLDYVTFNEKINYSPEFSQKLM